jgi:hypothetical protein
MALVGLGVPHIAAEGANGPTHDGSNDYILGGGEILQFDADRFREAYTDLGKKPGSHSVTISRARLAGPLPRGYGDTPRVARFEPGAVIDAHETVTWTLETTSQAVTSALSVGFDTLSARIPWAVLEASPQELAFVPPVEININGIPTILDAQSYLALLARVSSGEIHGQLALPAELSRMDSDFVDLQRFIDGAVAFFLVDSTLRRDDSWRAAAMRPAGKSCVSICFGCAGSALGGVASYAALIASCGGALVTGGSTALLCIAAFLGVQAAHVAMLGACGRCYECYTAQTGSPGPSRRDHGSSRLPESTFAKRRPGSATPLP